MTILGKKESRYTLTQDACGDRIPAVSLSTISLHLSHPPTQINYTICMYCVTDMPLWGKEVGGAIRNYTHVDFPFCTKRHQLHKGLTKVGKSNLVQHCPLESNRINWNSQCIFAILNLLKCSLLVITTFLVIVLIINPIHWMSWIG